MTAFEAPAQLTDGDLVIHVPRDGSRGSGPLYLDKVGSYGGDETQVAVSWLVNGPLAWGYGLPKVEVVPVGHIETEAGEREGGGFSLEALKRFAPAIKEARQAFYDRFPNFEDGRPSVHVSELKWPMRGYLDSTTLPDLIALSHEDILRIKRREQTMPLYNDETLIAYAVPKADTDAVVEPTAIGDRDFTVIHASLSETDHSRALSGYFATSTTLS